MSTTFRRDQRVIIRQVEAIADRRFIGVEGRYLGRAGMGNTGAYIVQVTSTRQASPSIVRARTIEAVYTPFAPAASAPSGTGEADGPILIDVKRAQAAALAHQLLGGPEAHLDDLIGVAEFLLGEHKPVERITALGETARVAMSSSLESAVQTLLNAAKPAPAMTLEDARQIVGSELTVNELAVRFDDAPDDDVVRVESYGTGYLKAADIDQLIRFLQAAKVVHSAR